MGLRRGGERIAVAALHADHPGAEGFEGLLRDLVERRALRGLVEQHGAAERQRFGGQGLRADGRERTARLAVAHPVAAESERLQVLLHGGAAETVVYHVGAAAI